MYTGCISPIIANVATISIVITIAISMISIMKVNIMYIPAESAPSFKPDMQHPNVNWDGPRNRCWVLWWDSKIRLYRKRVIFVHLRHDMSDVDKNVEVNAAAAKLQGFYDRKHNRRRNMPGSMENIALSEDDGKDGDEDEAVNDELVSANVETAETAHCEPVAKRPRTE